MASNNNNDLNMILSAKVVKLKVQLDAKGSKLHSQVDGITKLLKDKPVKLKVKLTATIKDINQDIASITTMITNAKTFKPMKIQVEIDVKGSAVAIKQQLDGINKTMDAFNSKYGKTIEDMRKTNAKAVKSAEEANKKLNIGTGVGVEGINNIKKYTKALDEAKNKLMQVTPKGDRNGSVFGSTQIKDANGNLLGFIATLKTAKGTVESLRYSFDSGKNRFQLIDRKTIDQTEDSLKKSVMQLQNLQRELGKTGDKAKGFTQYYNNLMRAGSEGTLTSDMVKKFERLIKDKQASLQLTSKENDLYFKQQKLIEQIANSMRKASKVNENDRSAFKNILTSVKDDGSLDNIKKQTLAYDKLNNKIAERNKLENDKRVNDIKRLKTLSQIEKLERAIVSTDKTSAKLIKEANAMTKVAKSADDWFKIQLKMQKLQASNNNDKQLQKSIDTQIALQKQYKKQLELNALSQEKYNKLVNAIPYLAQKGYADLERKLKETNRQTDLAIEKNNRLANSYKVLIDGSTANAGKRNLLGNITTAVDQNDITAMQKYIGQLLKGEVATANFKRQKDATGRAVDRFTVQMKGAGKQVRTYVVDLDRATGQLRQVEQGLSYNANRNLGVLEQLKVALARVPVWMGAMTVFYGTINGFRNITHEILEVDKALTDLRRVASDGINIEHIFEGSVKMAKDLGNNIHDVMKTLNEFARTYGEFNERQLLAITNTATLMSNVSELSADEAGQALVGTMNAFGILADESIRIADAFNEVDNNFAVSTKQLAEGMSKTASTAKTFGVSMEESIGHITAISSVTMESGKVIGNSLKTIYSRITTMDGAKSVLEDVGIAINDIEGNVRPVSDIIGELGGKWLDLTDSQRQNIAVTVAGRYQLSRFLAWMNNYQTSVDATATALTSQGSAMKENQKFLDSYEAKINSLKNTFTDFSLAMGDSFMNDAILLVIDGLVSIAEAGIKVADSLGALPAIFGIIGAGLAIFGVFKGTIAGLGGLLTNLQARFLFASGGARTFSGAMTGARASAGLLATTIGTTLVGAVGALWTVMKSALISTGIGALFVGLGFALEKLLGHIAKQKELAEDARKANETLIDSYKNTEGGLAELIATYEEMQNAVDSGFIVEGTEAWNEYLEVNQKIAKALPTMVEYVDSSGKAHMRTAEAMERELKVAEALSKEQDKQTIESYNANIKERIENIKNLTKESQKLAKELKDTESNNFISTDGTMYYDPKKVQEMKMSFIQATGEIQKEISNMSLAMRETITATLEVDEKFAQLTDTQKSVVESFVVKNENHLMKIYDDFKDKDLGDEKVLEQLTKELQKSTDELYARTIEVGEYISKKQQDFIEEASYGILDSRKIKEVEKEATKTFDSILKAIPKTFFSQENLSNIDDFEKAMNGAFDVREQIQNGASNFGAMQSQLEKLGYTQMEAKSIVASYGFELDNAAIKAEALKQKESGLIDETQGFIDVALEAIDATEKLFGYNDSDLSTLASNLDYLQQAKLMYKDNAKNVEGYGDALESVSWYLGVEEKQIEKNLGHYYTMANLLPKLTLKRKENGEVIGWDTEQLTAYEKKQLATIVTMDAEGNIIDAITGKKINLLQTNEELAESNDEVAKSAENSAQKLALDESSKRSDADATKLLSDRFSILKDEMNQTNKSAYIDTISQQLSEMDGQVLVTKDEFGKMKLVMADGSTSTFLDTVNQQISDLGISIGLSEDDAGNLKVTLNDGTGSTTLQTYEKDAKNTKLALDDVITNTDILKETNLLPNDYSLIDFVKLSSGIESTTGKVQLLSEGLQGTIENLIEAKKKVDEFSKTSENIKNTTDTIINNASGISTVRKAVEDLMLVLFEAQNAMGNIFSGLHISQDVSQGISNAKGQIESISSSASITTESINTLGRTLAGLGALTVGGLGEYVHQLGLLSHNLVLASSYGQIALDSQNRLLLVFQNAVSVTASYNSALANVGNITSESFNNMATAIANAISYMSTQYTTNIDAVNIMVALVGRALNTMVISFTKASRQASGKMTDMTTSMRTSFRRGTDRLVDIASGIPARIGSAIKKNMEEASSSMDAVAKDMVKRFKKELGIQSPSKVFESLGGDVIAGLARGLSGGDLKSLGQQVFGEFGGEAYKSADMMKAHLSGDYSSIAGMGATGSGVERWRGIATQALMMEGQYTPENLQRLLYQMQTESGGNPMAINLWDSNAKKGIPSKGLLQTIDPTFRAYAHPSHNKNVYDPLSNILASIRYAMSRYGSLSRAYRGVGYEEGGLITHEHMAMVGEGNKKEVVIPLEQHKDRAIDLWKTAGNYLGIDTGMLELLRGKGGSSYSAGMFGAMSGEGGSEGGGGDSGSSGIMQSSLIGFRGLAGEYDVGTKEIAERFIPNMNERNISIYSGDLGRLEGMMERISQYSASYRDNLKKSIQYQQLILNYTQKEYNTLTARQGVVNKRIHELSNYSKHTVAQRDEYNALQQEYDSNLSALQSLKSGIQSLVNDIKNRTTEIFSNMVEELTISYDKAFEKLQNKLDNIEFKISVASITNPDDSALMGELISQKIKGIEDTIANEYAKILDYTAVKATAEKKFGKLSDEADAIQQKIDEATTAYQSAIVEMLQAESEIKSIRSDYADDVIDRLKDYYSEMSQMETDAIDKQIDALEKAHQTKMSMYDDEIKKIQDVYNAKIKSINEESEQEDYQENVDNLVKEQSELQNLISKLSRNTDLESRKRVDELNKELLEKEKSLNDLIKEEAKKQNIKSIEEERDMLVESVEARRERDEKSHEQTIESLNAQKEAVAKYYNDIIEDEQRWAKAKDEMTKGNFNVLKGELTTLSELLSSNNSDLFSSMTTDFATYIETVQKGLADIQKATSSVGGGTSYGDAIQTDSRVVSDNANNRSGRGKLTTGLYSDETQAKYIVNNMKTTYKAVDAKLVKEAKGWRVVGEFEDEARATKVLADMKRLKKLQVGYISRFNTGGYTGDWQGNDGKLAILDKKEQVFNKDDTKRILDASKILKTMKNIIPRFKDMKSLDKSVTASQISNSISYGDINVTVQNGDKKRAKGIAGEIMTAIKKAGK